MNPIQPYPSGYLLRQPSYPLTVFPAKLVDILIPLAVILTHYLEYRISIRIMVDELLLARGPRLLGNRWGSYCWLRRLLGRSSWALDG
jgi:hypothetical protein